MLSREKKLENALQFDFRLPDTAINAYLDATKLWHDNLSEKDIAAFVQKHLDFIHFHIKCAFAEKYNSHVGLAQSCLVLLIELEKILEKPYRDREQPDNEKFLLGSLHFILAMTGTESQRNESEEYTLAIKSLSSIKYRITTETDLAIPMLAMCYQKLGNIYFNEGLHTQAVESFHTALSYYNNNTSKLECVDNINNVKEELKKIELPEVKPASAVADFVRQRDKLHGAFHSGSFNSEADFLYDNALLLQNSMKMFKETNDVAYLQFIIKTSELFREKLKGTAIILPFFQNNYPNMRIMNSIVQEANTYLNKPADAASLRAVSGK